MATALNAALMDERSPALPLLLLLLLIWKVPLRGPLPGLVMLLGWKIFTTAGVNGRLQR